MDDFKPPFYELSGKPIATIPPFDPESIRDARDALALYLSTLPPDESEYFRMCFANATFDEAEKLLNEYRINKGEEPIKTYRDYANEEGKEVEQ